MSFFAIYAPLIYLAGISCGLFQAHKVDKNAFIKAL